MNSKWHRIRKNDDLELYSHVSGLQVYHSHPNATSDSALLRVTFCIKSPTSNDTGIPHALEHLVFMPEPENTKCSSIDEFASLRLCTTVNGFTYDDHTCFSFSGISYQNNDGIVQVTTMLLSHILKPKFDIKTFHTEVFDSKTKSGVMYLELCDRECDTNLMASYACKKLLYQNEGSWNCSAAGLASLVASDLNLKDLREYHGKYYKPGNMALFLVGSVENVDEYLDAIDKTLPLDHDDFCVPLARREIISKDVFKSESLQQGKPLLIIAFEILNVEREACSVLLEFFKKNSSVSFSGFTFEISRIDSEASQVCIQFDEKITRRIGEITKEIGIHFKKSIAEYMNQVSKDLFVTCIQHGLKKSQLRTLLDQEIHPDSGSRIVNYFLYQDNLTDSDNLTKKSFEFWYSIAKNIVRSPWAIHFIGAEKDDFDEEIAEISQKKLEKNSKEIHQNASSSAMKFLGEEIRENKIHDMPVLHELIQELSHHGSCDNIQLGSSKNFTHIFLSYDLKKIKKTEMDFLPLIEILIAKGIRKLSSSPIRTQVHMYKFEMIVVATVEHENAEKLLTELLQKCYLQDLTDNVDLVAKMLTKENDTFDVGNFKFWRTFLRIKYVKKVLQKITEEDEDQIDNLEKVMGSILNKPSNIRVITDQDHKENLNKILKHDLFLKNVTKRKKTEPIFVYGYGHHRINVTDEINNGHACIMMSFPENISIEINFVMVEIMNLGIEGTIWRIIRDQGMAYSCTISIDPIHKEIMFLLQDCSDVINTLHLIQKEMKEFQTKTISPYIFEIAKRCAISKLIKNRDTSQFVRNQINFTEQALGMEPGLETAQKLLELSHETFNNKNAQKNFGTHFSNSKNLNIVVMLPKTQAMKMQTIKGFLTHGIKLFT